MTSAVIAPWVLVSHIRGIFKPGLQPWVLFRHGTLVGPLPAGEDRAEQARALMRAEGLVRPGSPVADFGVRWSTETPPLWPGWLVISHFPLILTYVGHEELPAGTRDIEVGLLGRRKRERDTAELDIVHVEDAELGPDIAASAQAS